MLEQYSAQAPRHVLSAIKTASDESGVDFSYLVRQASVESSFNPKAKARTSSATGLYQFIDSTWMQMINRYGEQYGIDTEGKSRKDILAMRNDPKVASFMAAAFASENEKSLKENWGGDIGATELYMAHFLGAGGASSFLKAQDKNPLQTAADLFPAAARSNRAVFYDSETGRPRTLAEVYDFFDRKFQVQTPEGTAIAQNKAPEMRESVLNRPNSIYSSYVRNSLSDSVVMQRAKAMREDSENPRYGGLREAHNAMPFYSLSARPVDVMMLTQVAVPSKVIRDKI